MGQEIAVDASCGDDARQIMIKVVDLEHYLDRNHRPAIRVKLGIIADGMEITRGELLSS